MISPCACRADERFGRVANRLLQFQPYPGKDGCGMWTARIDQVNPARRNPSSRCSAASC
jgi:hypothetical protein